MPSTETVSVLIGLGLCLLVHAMVTIGALRLALPGIPRLRCLAVAASSLDSVLALTLGLSLECAGPADPDADHLRGVDAPRTGLGAPPPELAGLMTSHGRRLKG